MDKMRMNISKKHIKSYPSRRDLMGGAAAFAITLNGVPSFSAMTDDLHLRVAEKARQLSNGQAVLKMQKIAWPETAMTPARGRAGVASTKLPGPFRMVATP